MIGVSLAVVPIYVAQALADDAAVWATGSLAIARLCIQIAMGLDVAIRAYLAPRRGRFLATHKLDILAIAVPPLRAAREIVGLRSILRRPGVGRFGAVSGVLIVGCALVVYASERDQVGASIQSLPDALWWAIVTASTVGYGDEVPVTDQGRLMAVILMLLGVALLAVLTAHVAAYFVDDGRDADRGELLDRLERIEATLSTVEAHLQHLAASEHVPSIVPLQREPR
jgi:voltage-gated potassium channel